MGQARKQGPEGVRVQMGPQVLQAVVGEDPLQRALRLTMVHAIHVAWVRGQCGLEHQLPAELQPP